MQIATNLIPITMNRMLGAPPFFMAYPPELDPYGSVVGYPPWPISDPNAEFLSGLARFKNLASKMRQSGEESGDKSPAVGSKPGATTPPSTALRPPPTAQQNSTPAVTINDPDKFKEGTKTGVDAGDKSKAIANDVPSPSTQPTLPIEWMVPKATETKDADNNDDISSLSNSDDDDDDDDDVDMTQEEWEAARMAGFELPSIYDEKGKVNFVALADITNEHDSFSLPFFRKECPNDDPRYEEYMKDIKMYSDARRNLYNGKCSNGWKCSFLRRQMLGECHRDGKPFKCFYLHSELERIKTKQSFQAKCRPCKGNIKVPRK